MSDGAKIFWLLMLCMAVNFLLMLLLMQCLLGFGPYIEWADTIVESGSASVLLKACAMAGMFCFLFIVFGYFWLYISVSLRIGRYICEYMYWDYEALFDFLVLGIADVVLFCVYWFPIIGGYDDRTSPYYMVGFFESIGEAFKIIYTTATPLAMTSAVLIIMYPLFLCIKTPLTLTYTNYKDEEKEIAEDYLHYKKMTEAFSVISSGDASNGFKKTFNKIAGLQYMKTALKNQKNKSRYVIMSAVFLAIVLLISCIYIIEPVRNEIFNMFLV